MRTLSTFSLHRQVLAFIFIVFAATSLFAGGSAQAAKAKYAGIVVDAKTGKTLYAHKADAARYPASLTKMMTLYMAFEALADKKMSKKTRIRMSRYAASMQPSKLGIKAGGSLSAEQAILALVTKSANDVAAALAEHLGGSESNFAKIMTRKARQLGMSRTTFKNASGLTAKGQLTTARDMARLGIALREHFPQYYRYFSTRHFKYGKRNYGNYNRLLGRVKGVDGIKTGYTRASGYNLVSSVETGGRSIVAVVIGGKSGKSRNAQMTSLISKYLGRASRGSKKLLVASRKKNTLVLASALKLPATGPVPVFRVRGNLVAQSRVIAAHSVQVASLGSVTSAGFKAGADFDAAAMRDRLLGMSDSSLPVPLVRPLNTIAGTDPVITAAVFEPAKPAGWQIQIGASDSKSKAFGLLKKAREKAPGALAGLSTYTETVEKGGTVLHRARFVGFTSKTAAWDACKALKRKKFACLALSG